jgi:hypothetical protein
MIKKKEVKQWNLNELKKIGYDEFIRKYKECDIEVEYKKIKILFQLNKISNLDGEYYCLRAENDPIVIEFKDNLHIPAKKIPHTIYLSYIHKNDKYSGSQLVKIAIAIAKHIRGVKFMYLCDMATIECNDVTDLGTTYPDKSFDLSLYSLIVNNYSFYNKYGFQYYDKNLKNKSREVAKHVKHVQHISVKMIVKSIEKLYSFIKKNYYKQIYYRSVYDNDFFHFNLNRLNQIINDYMMLYYLLKPYQKLTLKNAMIQIHNIKNNGCNRYFILLLKLIKEIDEYQFSLSQNPTKKSIIDIKWVNDLQKLVKYRRGLDGCYFIKKV